MASEEQNSPPATVDMSQEDVDAVSSDPNDETVDEVVPVEDEIMELQRVDTGTTSSQSMSPEFELNIPLFAEITQPYNRRTLLNHFTSELSTLMTFSGEDGNPFRELVLPMCERSKPLLFAVLALSSAHLEFKGVENKEASINLHTQALHLLSEALARQERGHALVTAIIMLIYYETVYGPVSKRICSRLTVPSLCTAVKALSFTAISKLH